MAIRGRQDGRPVKRRAGITAARVTTSTAPQHHGISPAMSAGLARAFAALVKERLDA